MCCEIYSGVSDIEIIMSNFSHVTMNKLYPIKERRKNKRHKSRNKLLQNEQKINIDERETNQFMVIVFGRFPKYNLFLSPPTHPPVDNL